MELLQPPLIEAQNLRNDPDTTHFKYLAMHARHMAEALSSSPPERGPEEHANDDAGTFSRLLEFLMKGGLDADQHETSYIQHTTTKRLNGLGHPFLVSLPFDEAERHWLTEVYEHSVEVYVENFEALGRNPTPEQEASLESPTDLLLHQSGMIVSAGLYQPVTASELLDRWSRWRNGEGEFADLDGPTNAIHHLNDIEAFVRSNKRQKATSSD